MSENSSQNNYNGYEIAVIGMSGIFPDAPDVHSLWENLKNGVESVTFFDDREVMESGVPRQEMDLPGYVKTRSLLEGKEFFDAHFFGYLPDEAKVMEPQTRVFHQCVWATLEDAGYDPGAYQGLIGLYAGAGSGFDWELYTKLNPRGNVDSYFAAQLGSKDFMATLVSYKLNLRGPSITVYTSCSTSLFAVHAAGQALLSGDCDMAVAGGVSFKHLTRIGYLYRDGGISSPDGHCRAFDAMARGTRGGEGAASVLLKPLDSAIEDRDHIYAIIKASCVTNDGWRKVGFTAPSVEGQAEAIKQALATAEVEPETVGYIESHGTGTVLGDPIEIEALRWAYGSGPKKTCAIGAIKSNLGHLDSAAGITGFIKTVMVVNDGIIPPNILFQSPNPKLELEKTPFYFNTETVEWKPGPYPRRAGVSSFGIGGNNVHIILEQAPQPKPSPQYPDFHILPLSGATNDALLRNTARLKDFINAGNSGNSGNSEPGINIGDAAFTLQQGRKALTHRGVLVCRDTGEAARILANPGAGGFKSFTATKERHMVVFMFPGQGAQYVNMAKGLYEKEPLFRETVDQCVQLAGPGLGAALKEVLYPAGTGGEASVGSEPLDAVNQTGHTQPLLFIVEYALAKLLMSWGITPDVMIGHSIGEYTAACLSGVLSLQNALQLVIQRGRLMQDLPAGKMMSVQLPEEETGKLLLKHANLSLAAVNAPGLCVVSGPGNDVELMERELKQEGVECRVLHTSHGFHSAMMDPILQSFEQHVARMETRPPGIPIISNLTGEEAGETLFNDPKYWCSHLRGTVRFSKGIQHLLSTPNPLFIEVGPGKTLSTFVQRHAPINNKNNAPSANTRLKTVALMRHPREDVHDMRYLLEQIGECWLYGLEPDWDKITPVQGKKRIPLPTYSFEKNPYPCEYDLNKILLQLSGGRSDFSRRQDTGDWFYEQTWKRAGLLPGDVLESSRTWLIFQDKHGLGKALSEIVRLSAGQGAAVIDVLPGTGYRQESDTSFTVAPGNPMDYERLFRELNKNRRLPGRIVHLWTVTREPRQADSLEAVKDAQDTGFYSLLSLARGIGAVNGSIRVEIGVVSDHLHEVIGGEPLEPAKSTLLGAVRVIPREYKNVRCRGIDICLSPQGDDGNNLLARQIYNEMLYRSQDPVLAYRGKHRWVMVPEQVKLPRPLNKPAFPAPGDVCLVTGGLGGIGLVLSRYLAENVQAKLILTGRRSLPEPSQWDRWLDAHAKDDKVSAAIINIKELEKLGAQVRYVSCDAADAGQLEERITAAETGWGPVTAIIHAAGIADYAGVIQSRTREANEDVFAAKIDGTVNLHHFAGKRPVKIFYTCSSLAAALGFFGQAGYCAANMFQNAFAAYRDRVCGQTCKTVSIGWDTWREVGMAVEAVLNNGGQGMNNLRDAIYPDEGVDVFIRTLGHSYPVLDVSVRDLPTVLQMLDEPKKQEPDAGISQRVTGSAARESRTGSAGNRVERPQLTSMYAAPETPPQGIMAELWEEFFGYNQVGIYDDFFELGGDSLKAMTMLSRVERETGTRIPLAEVFKCRNIKELTQYIEENREQEPLHISRAEKREFYPVSSAQKRLYFIQQKNIENTGYNLIYMVQIQDRLDLPRLENVFRQIINRQASLRTAFVQKDGEPVQVVHDDVEFAVETGSIVNQPRGTGSPDVQQTAARLTREFVRPFDLSQAPLFRVKIVELEQDKFLFMSDMHHIISDGWSTEVFTAEVLALYSGIQLEPLAVQYIDYSQWQYEFRCSPEFENQRQYWLDAFSGQIPVLELPTDYVRPRVQSFEGRTIHFSIAPPLSRQIKELAIDEKTTLFGFFLAAYYVFLGKLSGQDAVVAGSPVSGRYHSDLEPIVGMFANTLALTGYPSPGKTFNQFAGEVHHSLVDALENQDYPFEELVRDLGGRAGQDASRNPLFDAAFSFETSRTAAKVTTPGTGEGTSPISSAPYENRTSKFDMMLNTAERGESFLCFIEYSTRLFKRETIQCFQNYFIRILEHITQNPAAALGTIEIISQREKQRVMEEFNNTAAEYPFPETLHGLFRQQALKTPDRTALTGYPFENTIDKRNRFTTVTYSQLDSLSGNVAHRLRASGVRPGNIVGLMVERSLEMITAVMGILKTGAAYLPLDLQFPEDRVKYMCLDSGVRVMLTRSGLSRQFPYIQTVVPLDHTAAYIEAEPAPVDDAVESSGQSGAYVIYTSGTTGKPKGLYTTHANAVRVVRNTNYIDIQPGDRLLQWSNYAFDGSVFDIYGTLLNGAAMHLVPHGEAADTVKLASEIKDHKITVFFITTALFNALVDTDRSCLTHIRKVLFGGERVSVDHTRRALEITGPGKILHVYGPTETTVYATYYPVDHIDDRAVTIPIGAPLSNTTVFVLSPQMLLLPPLVTGELYIGGTGLAKGYLNNPELTAERFVLAHSSKLIARREEQIETVGHNMRSFPMSYELRATSLYKTGDLVRWLHDGAIEFLGRVDQQVKIRGFRIELGEIENRLRLHDAVKEAVVIDFEREDQPGKSLCAYITLQDNDEQNDEQNDEKNDEKNEEQICEAVLKKFLGRELPVYMIPPFFVFLDDIPLDQRSGKLDRASLPLPQMGDTGDAAEPPTSNTEIRLAALWADILGIPSERIGRDSDFFAGGGHSIDATLLAARIHREFHVEIPLGDIFAYPVLSEMANHIENTGTSRFKGLTPVEDRDYYELSSAQQRVYVVNQMDDQGIGYNMPNIFAVEGDLDTQRLEETFRRIIQRHESFRTSFDRIGEKPVQRIHPHVDFAIEYYDDVIEIESPGAGVYRPVSMDPAQFGKRFVRPFDLTRAPLLRVQVIKTRSQTAPFVLVTDMHHIVSDGFSTGILVREFMALYNNIPLPGIQLRYRDYSQWRNEETGKEQLIKQKEYWHRELSGELPVLELPADFPRPPIQSFQGDASVFIVEGPVVNALRQAGEAHGATMFMMLIAVYSMVLSKLSRKDDIIIGTVTTGRSHADLEHMIGMFVNTLALRNRPKGDFSFQRYLQDVKTNSLQAFDNQDYQYEDLVRELDIDRDVSRNPLFDTVLALQSIDIDRPEIPGVALKPFSFQAGVAKFDLNLMITEAGDILQFTIEYGTRLFKQETIERLFGYIRQTMIEIGKNPSALLKDIDILAPGEKKRIVYEFNHTAAEYSREKTMHQLFEEQAEKTPDATAVVFDGRHVSYRELNRRSSGLARMLYENRTGANPFVAVLMERSVEMIAGVMAIVKSGGAYVPLEPYLPEARIAGILENLNIETVLTRPNQLEQFSAAFSRVPDVRRVICLGWDSEDAGRTLNLPKEAELIDARDFTAYPADRKLPAVDPGDVAYTIFTSGSTGTPKGVMVRHRPAINLIEWVNTTFNTGAGDKVLFITSLGFDLSVYDIFGMLASGGCIRLVSAPDIKNPNRLLEMIIREGITFWDSAPAALQLLVPLFRERSEGRDAECLRLVFLSGDWIPVTMPAVLEDTFKNVNVISLGGATEATVWSNFYPIHHVEPHWPSIPYGKPIQNAAYYVLDNSGGVCPVGVPGDLFIGGQCLASGYINDVELTASKFIPDPFLPGSLMYRTGDVARWFGDGNMEFLGRSDNQVKIRGFRIELGEIESQMANHEAVKDAVAAALDNEKSQGRLIGYAVPEPRTAFPVLQRLRMEKSGQTGGRAVTELENRMPVFYINRNEIEFMYHEVFEEESYLKHNIVLPDNACVIDVGANIGFFSILVHHKCTGAKLHAVEPIPEVCEILELNTALYGVDAAVHSCGLAGESGQSEFTYYPNLSILSGRFGKEEEEREAVKTYISNLQSGGNEGHNTTETEEQMEELLQNRLENVTRTIEIKTLSQLIRENNIEKIDLLKINVEKSEADMLAGIEDQHWPLISQVSLEVHDMGGKLENVTAMLESRGYQLHVDQEAALGDTRFYHVYAVRPGAVEPGTPQAPGFCNARDLIDNIKTGLQEKLPEYMIPQAFVLMDRVPLTPNGKVDRKALPEPVLETTSTYAAPTDDIETHLVDIWREVLGMTPAAAVGIDDNFFELGGHSLNATTLTARIHKLFDVKMPIAEVFRCPQIRSMAHFIRAAARQSYRSIPVAEYRDHYLLSSAQRRLYLLQRMEPSSIGYNIPNIMQFRGEIHRARLQYTFERMIKRHESFRTSFHMEGDVPVQRIHDNAEFQVIWHQETRTGSGPASSREIKLKINQFIRPFDLAIPPLIRAEMVRIDENNHLVMIDMHHIISDGESFNVFNRDFMAIFRGSQSALPSLNIQYKDYAQWQNSGAGREKLTKQEQYWLSQFEEEIPQLYLPLDYPRPPAQSLEGKHFLFELDRRDVQQLGRVVKDEEVTTFMALLSAYYIMLARIGNQEDIVVGTPVAGRVSEELEPLIGMFVNMLPVRNRPQSNKSFLEFLREVRKQTLDAFDNQEYQYEDLVEIAPVERDPSRNPIFDAGFSLQVLRSNETEQRIDGVEMQPYGFDFDIAKFDIGFVCTEWDDRINISVQYSTRLFKEITIKRLSRYYKKIVSHISSDPGVLIGKIDLLSRDEQGEMLDYLTGEDSGQPVADEYIIHRRFEDRAAQSPDAAAVVLEDQMITYGTLNRKSNRLAHALRRRGVGPDQMVGIMMDDSIDRIAAILGILKAGGAYLPVDPEYPGERIRFMLDDADSRLLLTDSAAMTEHKFTYLQNVDGANTIHRSMCRSGSRSPIRDLNSLPFVDRSLVDYDKYNCFIGQAMVKHAFSIVGSRGCPYNCAYCHKIWPKKHVFRTADNIYEEVSKAYDLGVKRFAFIDDIFNLNEKNSREFFNKIIDNKLDIQIFFPNGVRGDILTPDYMDLMVKAGTSGVAMALETGSPRLQKLVGKNMKLDRLRDSLNYFCKNYPQVILELFLMHGFPSETEEEAKMTIDFLKELKWVHFPYFHILKIYPNTDMAALALANGVSEKQIHQSANLAFHELPLTLPFDKRFTLQLQSDFLDGYFLNKERLLHVLPHQMRTLTHDELVQKYDSYLPFDVKTIHDFLDFAGIKKNELDLSLLKEKEEMEVPGLHKRTLEVFPSPSPAPGSLRVLLIDLSQYFSSDTKNMLYSLVEPPLGLMSLMTSLKQDYGAKINGKVGKSRIDFDNFDQMKEYIEDFRPHIIGLRTLTYYKDFLHQSVAMMRQWGIDVPVISGGPYASSDYNTMLNDPNINLAVIGEGERTMSELVGHMLENGGVQPSREQLAKIPGLAFVDRVSDGVNRIFRGDAREILHLDSFESALAAEPDENPEPVNSPGDTAYVIYTSGTTGKPKGVMVEHGNVGSLMATGEQLFQYGKSDIWTMFHNFCFDFSVWEMYGPLMFGGKLVLVPRMTARDPEQYVDLLKKQQVTILNQTPTVFYTLIEEEGKSENKEMNVRFVIFGGEALKPGKLLPWVERYPVTSLINMYGITETTVHVTFKEIGSRELMRNISNIGRPVASLSARIIDKYMQTVPFNVPGELAVGGQGVARGYLNRPELTAERFYEGRENGRSRLYRSGDLVRLLNNGEMEYMGRIDHQVKIRGNRVELGEIERQMMQLPEIRESMVMARQYDNGDNYLCAYMTMAGTEECSVTELRNSLSKRLPVYMIPSHFITLDEFPVTSSGKVNRRLLPLPHGMRPSLGSAFAAPETEIARNIAAIWQEVLGVDQVGIYDNFFDLGGTSLEIVKLNTRLKEMFNRDIPVVSMFEYPTIDTFIGHLDLDKPGTPAEEPKQPEAPDFSGKLQKGRAKMKGRRQRTQK